MALADLIHTHDDFVPTKALLVVAHPDDIDFGAAGTVATLTDHGVEVVYGLVADLALRKAIARLIRIVTPDLVITQTPVRNLDRIYAAHPDHLAAGEATVSAVYPDARNGHSFPELLAEGHRPHAVPRVWLMAGTDHDLHVDITHALDRKIEALFAHESQNAPRADVLPAMIRDWAHANAAAAAGHHERAIESFRVIHTE